MDSSCITSQEAVAVSFEFQNTTRGKPDWSRLLPVNVLLRSRAKVNTSRAPVAARRQTTSWLVIGCWPGPAGKQAGSCQYHSERLLPTLPGPTYSSSFFLFFFFFLFSFSFFYLFFLFLFGCFFVLANDLLACF